MFSKVSHTLRRMGALFLAAALACSMLCLPALAAESGFVIVDGVLGAYHGSGGDVVIPSGVTKIGSAVFWGCKDLTDITIPDSVTEIGYGAFSGCTGLTDITIPDSVTTIGDRAFEGCSGSTDITIPDSVTTIGAWAFEHCHGLTDITIPGSVTTVGERAFQGCTGLTDITITSSVATIGRSAFQGCTGLTDASVASMGMDMFEGCTSLTNIIIADGVTTIGERAFAVSNMGSALTSITIPDSVTTIGESAFFRRTGLTNITIPDSVTTIGAAAFSGCSGLTSVTIAERPLDPSNVAYTTIGGSAFAGCTSLTDITIPVCVSSISERAFEGAYAALLIHGTAGSYAETYAKNSNLYFTTSAATNVVPMAYARTQAIAVNGQDVTFQLYAIKDGKGNETNYIKLRDLAYALKSTTAQFSVTYTNYDSSTKLQSKSAYVPNGSEMTTPYSGDQRYKSADISNYYVNGEVVKDLKGILISDQGGGYTYFKLRDLAALLGFDVVWNGSIGKIEIHTPQSY